MKKSFVVFSLCFLMVSFQNCSRASFSNPDALASEKLGDNEPEVPPPVDSGTPTAGFHLIKQFHFPYENGETQQYDEIEVNLQTKHVRYGFPNGFTACNLQSDSRLEELSDLMADSQVCMAQEPPPGTVSCLAIGIPDVSISNGDDEIILQPFVCSSGIDLCGNASRRLRNILKDLKHNLPSDCETAVGTY